MPLIQDIFRQYGAEYLQRYGPKMPAIHKKALKAIISCRSKSLGGEVYYCAKCKEYHYSYHSCQNRHCVVCGNNDAADWIAKNKKLMLPFTYFLGTFTLPGQLREICRSNQKLTYNIFFKASSDALKLLAKDDKYLGADIGMTGILHTWTRALIYHPHVHYLVPGGGIGSDGRSIRFSDDDFLMHVKPLSKIFKAKFREALKMQASDIFEKIPADTWKRDWVVHIKPVGDGQKALEYMGRYLFRTAISNNRILKLETCTEQGRSNGKVTFRYTDSKTGKTKIVTLEALEFIRRFLQHVLPKGFQKVRCYGFLAAAARKRLSRLRKMLWLDSPSESKHRPLPKPLLCPVCGSVLEWIEHLPKARPEPRRRGPKDRGP
jgi:hypothetical protein